MKIKVGDPLKTSLRGLMSLEWPKTIKITFLLVNYGKEKKRTLCFASFCLTIGLNHKKSMTVLKLCKKSSKCDVAGDCSFIRLEMAMVWRKKSPIEKSAYFNSFPMTNFSFSVFVNYAAQDYRSYLLSMSKLKSFKFSLKWRQERIDNSMRLIFMLE